MLKPTRVAVLAGSAIALLSGCSRLLWSDFDNGTELARIEIGTVGTVSSSIDLPEGEADLRFVVRDFDCTQPLGAAINVWIGLADGTEKQREVSLDDLRWPMAGEDCRPIGYLRLDDAKYTHPLSLNIGRQSNPVRFSFEVVRASDAKRQVSIWVVYNDREPVGRMLAETEGGARP